jgi:hypothetical protein
LLDDVPSASGAESEHDTGTSDGSDAEDFGTAAAARDTDATASVAHSKASRKLTLIEWIQKRLVGKDGELLPLWVSSLRGSACFYYGINPAEMLNALLKSNLRFVFDFKAFLVCAALSAGVMLH